MPRTLAGYMGMNLHPAFSLVPSRELLIFQPDYGEPSDLAHHLEQGQGSLRPRSITGRSKKAGVAKWQTQGT